MAKIKYAAPIASINGAWAPGCVCRQKKFRVGNRIVLGPKEAFHKNKRDYARHPQRGAEKASSDRFRQAEARRKQEMADPVRLAYWQSRFEAQLCTPEPGNSRSYHRLDAFIRTMLMRDLSAAEPSTY